MDYDAVLNSHRSAAPPVGDGGMREVIGWVSSASLDTRDLVDIGGWGGFMSEDKSWRDYIANIDAKYVAHYEALRHAIVATGLRRGGDWHQNAPDGVPVFDDGAIGRFSFRAWATSWQQRGPLSMVADMDTCTFTWIAASTMQGWCCRLPSQSSQGFTA